MDGFTIGAGPPGGFDEDLDLPSVSEEPMVLVRIPRRLLDLRRLTAFAQLSGCRLVCPAQQPTRDIELDMVPDAPRTESSGKPVDVRRVQLSDELCARIQQLTGLLGKYLSAEGTEQYRALLRETRAVLEEGVSC